MDNPWSDYSDEELIDFLRNNPDQLKLARAAPNLLFSLKHSRTAIGLLASWVPVTSQDTIIQTSKAELDKIQAESFEAIVEAGDIYGS